MSCIRPTAPHFSSSSPSRRAKCRITPSTARPWVMRAGESLYLHNSWYASSLVGCKLHYSLFRFIVSRQIIPASCEEINHVRKGLTPLVQCEPLPRPPARKAVSELIGGFLVQVVPVAGTCHQDAVPRQFVHDEPARAERAESHKGVDHAVDLVQGQRSFGADDALFFKHIQICTLKPPET